MLYPIFSDDPASFLYPSHFHQMNRYNNSSTFNGSGSSLLNHSNSGNIAMNRPNATNTTDNFYSRYNTPYNSNQSTSSSSTDFLSNNRFSTVPIKSYSDDTSSSNSTSNDSLGIFHSESQPSRSLYHSQQQQQQEEKEATDNSTGSGNGNNNYSSSNIYSSIPKRTDTIGGSPNNSGGDDKEGN